jgi:hypothetical protein
MAPGRSFGVALSIVVVAGCAVPRPARLPRPMSPPKNPDHLVAHYSFDDCSARDVSGKKHDGVVAGAPGCVDGPVGKAMSFDGAHDFITVPAIASDPFAAELTVTGWVKAYGFGASPAKWVTILTIGNSSMETPFAVIYAVDEQGHIFPHTRLTSATGQLDLKLLREPAGVEGTWLFFAWTFNRGKVNVYSDGTLVTSYDSGLPQLASTSEPIDIGRDVPGATEYLKGALDDVRLFDSELPQDQIRKLWELGNRLAK